MKNLRKLVFVLGVCLVVGMISNVFASSEISPKKNLVGKNIKQELKTKNAISSSLPKVNSLTALADPYEPNDYIEDAKRMPSDTINANIGYDGDWDFYLHYFAAGSKIKVTLAGIPVNCDYDIFLCSTDGTILQQSINGSNMDEYLKYNIVTSGDYLVVVIPYIGYNDSQNYTLYAGTRLVQATGNRWYDLPALSLTSVNTWSSTDSLDLRYEPIPNDAVVTSMYLYGSYIGNFGNQAKEVYVSQVSTWFRADMSDSVPVAGAKVKQIWYFHWAVQYILQRPLSWTPSILINYTYINDPDPIL